MTCGSVLMVASSRNSAPPAPRSPSASTGPSATSSPLRYIPSAVLRSWVFAMGSFQAGSAAKACASGEDSCHSGKNGDLGKHPRAPEGLGMVLRGGLPDVGSTPPTLLPPACSIWTWRGQGALGKRQTHPRVPTALGFLYSPMTSEPR